MVLLEGQQGLGHVVCHLAADNAQIKNSIQPQTFLSVAFTAVSVTRRKLPLQSS